MNAPREAGQGRGSFANRDNHGTQINNLTGSAVFNQAFYQHSPHDTPEQKLTTAKRMLSGASPRAAEELMRSVLRGGVTTAEAAYHYILAIVSERSFNELGQDELQELVLCFNMAEASSDDGWRDAVATVRNLLASLMAQMEGSGDGPERLDDVLTQFTSLPNERRVELNRHLSRVLTGALQDRIDRVNADLVTRGRVADRRQERVPLFFHPDPIEPRETEGYHTRKAGLRAWAALILGPAAFLGACMTPVLTLSATAVLWLCLVLAGSGVAVWFGAPTLAFVLRRQRLEAEYETGSTTAARYPADELPRGSQRFRANVRFLAEYQFSRDKLRRGLPRSDFDDWAEAMHAVRETLIARLIHTYGDPVPSEEELAELDERSTYAGDMTDYLTTGDDHDRDVPVNGLNWLIKWHAERAAARWVAGTMFDFRKWRAAQLKSMGLAAAGAALVVTGVYGAFTAAGTTPVLGVAAVLLVIGATGALVLGGTRLARREERDDHAQLHQEEMDVYRDWVEKLKDRPTDAEMGRWLDFDKTHLRSSAMRRMGLTNRDILGSVVLSEGKPNAKRARVVFGPPRYSEYKILIFLLTGNGVRQISVDLDFEDGAVHDEQRMSFRYESLSSARVSEVGVQFANEKRTVIFRSKDQFTITEETENVVFSRAFRLTLDNAEDITVVVESFEGLYDTKTEDQSKLMDLALDTSGVTAALHILEAIAAEGREWFLRENERRRRRWREWDSGSAAPKRIVGNTALTSLLEEAAPAEDSADAAAFVDADVVDAEVVDAEIVDPGGRRSIGDADRLDR